MSKKVSSPAAVRADIYETVTVTIVAAFPPDSHPPIVYPVAITKDSRNPDASAFLAYLRGPAAKAAFERQGFTVLNRATTAGRE